MDRIALALAAGARVEALRKAAGFSSQADFAKIALKIGPTKYNNWLNGTLIPIEFAVLVCAKTGGTLDYIYRGDISTLPVKLAALIEFSGDPGQTGEQPPRAPRRA